MHFSICISKDTMRKEELLSMHTISSLQSLALSKGFVKKELPAKKAELVALWNRKRT